MMELREELEGQRRDMKKALALVEEMRKARVEYLKERENHYLQVLNQYKEEANEANKLMQEFTHLREDEDRLIAMGEYIRKHKLTR